MLRRAPPSSARTWRAAARGDHRGRRRGAARPALARGARLPDGRARSGCAAWRSTGGRNPREGAARYRAAAGATARSGSSRPSTAGCAGCRGCAASCSGRSDTAPATGSPPGATSSAAPCSAGRSPSKNGMHYFRGMPKWSFGRGGTTIGAIYLTTTATTSDNVLEHEADAPGAMEAVRARLHPLVPRGRLGGATNRFEVGAGLETAATCGRASRGRVAPQAVSTARRS